MIFNLGGHIDSSVSALVDGQLAEDDAERAWSHVLGCPGCRRLVEREGWIKSRLAALSGNEPSARLLGSLYDVEAWSAADAIGRTSKRRRNGLVAVGAGSVGVAVLGIASLGGAGLGISQAPAGPPTTSINGPASQPASPAPVLDLRRRTK